MFEIGIVCPSQHHQHRNRNTVEDTESSSGRGGRPSSPQSVGGLWPSPATRASIVRACARVQAGMGIGRTKKHLHVTIALHGTPGTYTHCRRPPRSTFLQRAPPACHRIITPAARPPALVARGLRWKKCGVIIGKQANRRQLARCWGYLVETQPSGAV